MRTLLGWSKEFQEEQDFYQKLNNPFGAFLDPPWCRESPNEYLAFNSFIYTHEGSILDFINLLAQEEDPNSINVQNQIAQAVHLDLEKLTESEKERISEEVGKLWWEKRR